jgi:hypothetical protein
VHGTKIFPADQVAELIPCGFVALGGCEIVTGGERMAGVDADSNAFFVFNAIDYTAYLVKRESEI